MNTSAPATAMPRALLRRATPSGPSALPVSVACPAAVLTVQWDRSRGPSRRRSALEVLTYTVVPPPALDSLTATPLREEKEAFPPGPPSPPLKELPLPASVLTLRPAARGTTRTRPLRLSVTTTAPPPRAAAQAHCAAKANCEAPSVESL
jgi:hypothetical protein